MNRKLQADSKLIVTIVNKGMARRVVAATKGAGAEGGTVLMGSGTGTEEMTDIFGIEIEPEKEVVLTLADSEKIDNIISAVTSAGKLNKRGEGIAFVVEISKTAGICHKPYIEIPNQEKRRPATEKMAYELIITIVNRGDAEKVVEASKDAGARGGTILSGRGTGIHEKAKLFGITIEPEKEIILTLVEQKITDRVLDAIVNAAKLNKPGKGIAFVLGVGQVVGINHPSNQ